jgi:hypothetical protein
MAISLKNLRRVTASSPPRVLIYAPPGMGKTTLANEFPNAVFLQTEQGEGSKMELDTFGLLTSYDEIMEAIASLYQEEHSYQTVVTDSLDKLEPLVWAAVCKANNWQSIEQPGYGKGYIAADAFWRDYLGGLNALRNERGMNIVMLSHSTVERFDDPRTTSYSRYDIRLHKRAQALVEDEVDFIAFINQEASIKEEDAGFNKKRSHAEGGAQRWIYCEGRPSMNAKNRYDMPPKILFQRGNGYAELAKYFPSAAKSDQAEQKTPVAEAA